MFINKIDKKRSSSVDLKCNLGIVEERTKRFIDIAFKRCFDQRFLIVDMRCYKIPDFPW